MPILPKSKSENILDVGRGRVVDETGDEGVRSGRRGRDQLAERTKRGMSAA